MYRLALSVALLAATAAAQCVSNTNNNCQLGALPQDGTTVYYAPTDSGDIEFFGQALGTCDTGSSADVSFYSTYQDSSSSNFIVDCGCLPLDGNTHVLDCGIPKGTIPEGPYHFVIQLNADYAGLDRFNIVHTQVTSTASTPTQTQTVYSTETDTVTTTSTETDTATYPQVTVTTPAGTMDVTNTVSPTTVSTTVTQTATYTETKVTHTVSVTTATHTAPCTTAKPARCPIEPKTKHRLLQRQQNGYTVTGDGPPTTTVTPNPVIVTETDNGGTTTQTDTAYSTTTTTVQPTPLTTTSYSGTATDIFTVTLPTPTSTITRHTATCTTVTRTSTIRITRTAKVTPTCRPHYVAKGQPKKGSH